MVLPVLLVLGSCCKKRAYCKYESLKIAFTGFNRSETRSVMLKRYPKDKIGGRALDSALFLYSGSKPVISGKPDTLWFSDYTTNGNLDGVTPGNDWTLNLQGANKVYVFTLVADEGHTYEVVRCGKDDGCINKTAHYFTEGTYYNSGTAYLKR